MQTRWEWKSFDTLSGTDVYTILHLRVAVFVEEQNYAYQDLDLRDSNALHLLGWDDSNKSAKPRLAAYARLIFPEQKDMPLEISRVVVQENYRQNKLGSQLMTQMIKKIESDYGTMSVSLIIAEDEYSKHIQKFYGRFGFKLVDSNPIHNPNYTYKNFEITCFEMSRPASSAIQNPIKQSSANYLLSKSLQVGVLLLSVGMFARKLQYTPDETAPILNFLPGLKSP